MKYLFHNFSLYMRKMYRKSSNNLLPIFLNVLGGLYVYIDAATIRCYDGSVDKYTEVNLTYPNPLLTSSGYDPTKETVFCTHGFITDSDGESVTIIVKDYLQMGTLNICSLDWRKEASGGLLGPLGYAEAVNNTISIGKLFGKALIILIEAGMRIFSLIGFSLGAHLIGYAGKEVQTIGRNITRLIGLDAAGPLYEGPVSYEALDASCGTFVLILHTDPGIFGTVDRIATVDVWVNCGSPIQPGCVIVACSHNRAYLYYGEALARPNSFIARAARSCKSWQEGEDSNQTLSIVNDIDISARGDYYLQTNSVPYYGKGLSGSFYQP